MSDAPSAEPGIAELARALRNPATGMELTRTVTQQAFFDRLRHQGVTELFGHLEVQLPDEILSELAQRCRAAAALELLRQHELQQVFVRLRAAGIERCLVFKGGGLAYSVFEQPWLRPRVDTDILISRSNVSPAIDALSELGYRKLNAVSGQWVSNQTILLKQINRQNSHNLDIHWRISNAQVLANCFSLEELLETATLLPGLAPQACTPSTIHAILIAALHVCGHHYDDQRLIWFYDVHALAGELGEGDWHELEAQATRRGIAAITHRVLARTHELLASPVPDAFLADWGERLPGNEPSRLFLSSEISSLALLMSNLKALPRWRDRAALIREHLLPDSEYMRVRSENSGPLALAYLARIGGGIWKYLRELLRRDR